MSEYELETKLRRHILLLARHKLTSALKRIRRCQTHFLARLGLWHPLAILRAYRINDSPVFSGVLTHINE
jgi:hypothetical protein